VSFGVSKKMAKALRCVQEHLIWVESILLKMQPCFDQLWFVGSQ
jgi:hypothetical protein